MKKRIFSLILCMVMMACALSATVSAASNIDTADIMITYPAHSANPDPYAQINGNCRIDTSYNSKGHRDGIRWKDLSTGEYVEKNDAFVGGRQYELSVYLISKTGYSFSLSTSTITVNSEAATLNVIDVNHAQATITLTADNLYANSVVITDIDDPKVGNTADFSATVQGTGCELYASGNRGMSWLNRSKQAYMSQTDKFQAGNGYSVGIYIQVKAGYEFPSNVQVTINGEPANVSENNGRLLKAVLEFPTLSEQHTHTPSTWRTTGAYHYTVCTTCGDFLDQEDHKGGVATCSEKGKCTVCGYAYIEENEKHTPDTSKWTACGDLYHAHLCKDCGAHAITEDHKPGPAATETTAQKCTVCGYIIAPAKNHKHKLTKVAKVDATCTEAGNVEYYTCDGCFDFFSDKDAKTKLTNIVIAPLGHKLSDDWKYDANNHWRVCSVCKEILSETQMAHGMENEKCTTCGYVGTTLETNSNTESKSETQSDTSDIDNDNTDKNNGNNLLWLWILVAVIVVVGGGFAIYWFAFRKKKENVE